MKNREKKKNYKPKANDRGKENNATFFFDTWPCYEMKKKMPDVPYITFESHVPENISEDHFKFQSGKKKPREIWKEV